MSSELKLRRGSTVAHSTFTGADGEVTFDTDKNVIVSHDGATAGGFPHTKAADLAAPNGAALVTYLPSGTGAIATNVQSKLREEISALDFYANGVSGAAVDPTGILDSTLGIQAAINYAMSVDKSLHIPSGIYKITNTLNITASPNCEVFGDGLTTTLSVSVFTGAAINLLSTSDWSSNKTVLRDLAIVGTTKTANQTAVFVDAAGAAGIHISNVYVKRFDFGFYLNGTQFCSFSNLSATNCSVGCYLVQSSTGGGGNNNTYYDCFFSSNIIGVLLLKNSPYPFHNNKFINLVTHSNLNCAFYANGIEQLSIENWAPESNNEGGGALSTYDVNGVTVKAGILNAVNSTITLRNYLNVSNINPITLEKASMLCFDGYGGATFIPVTDSTSFFTFSSASASLYSGTGSAIFINSPIFKLTGTNFRYITLAPVKNTGAIPNDALALNGHKVNTGYASAGTANINAYVVDSEMGYVLEATYINTTSSLIIKTLRGGYSGIGTKILFSAMVKSSSSTASWTLNFAQSSATAVITLPADVWVRVVIVASLQSELRAGYISINATSTAVSGETLRICKIQSNHNISNALLASIVGNNLYNPGRWVTDVTRLSAIPTTGTWEIGNVAWNTTPAPSGYIGWVCTTAGTMGTLNGGATTGNITINTQALTVNSITGLSVGQLITIAGVSGVKNVISLVPTTTTGSITSGTTSLVVAVTTNYVVGTQLTIAGVTGAKTVTAIVGNTITIDSAADATVASAVVAGIPLTITIDSVASATVTGAAVAFSTGVWKTFGAISP